MTLLHFMVEEAEKEHKEILAFTGEVSEPLKIAVRYMYLMNYTSELCWERTNTYTYMLRERER